MYNDPAIVPLGSHFLTSRLGMIQDVTKARSTHSHSTSTRVGMGGEGWWLGRDGAEIDVNKVIRIDVSDAIDRNPLHRKVGA